MTRARSFPNAAWLAWAAVLCLAASCGGEDGDRGSLSTSDSLAADPALPPSGAPRASRPGQQPDTVRPAPRDTGGIVADTHRHLTPAELDVDSIAGSYRNHYRAEFVDRRSLEGQEIVLDVDPDVVEAAQRRTALEWGYVELDAWEHLLGDLSESQRLELERRNDEFHRGMGGSPPR